MAWNDAPLVHTSISLSIIATIIYLVGRRFINESRSDIGNLKKPAGGHWLWGHEADLFRTSDMICSDFVEELGGLFPIKGALFHPDILIVADPGAIGQIFTKNPYNYSKGRNIRSLQARVIGKGLNWADGDEHRRQRLLLSPCFTPAKVQRMENDILSATDKLTESLRLHVTESSVGNDCYIDLITWTWRATLDIIGAVGFGHDFECGSSPEAKGIFRGWNQMVSGGLTWGGFVGPLVFRALPFLAKLPLPAIERQMEIRRITQVIGRRIVEERTLQHGPHTDREDLLSVLLRTSPREDGIGRILEHINTFFLVGHETTVTTINFALYELSKHKCIQDRLRQELKEFASSRKGGGPTYEEYQSRLPYLDAVCKEALRLYPSASRLVRVALNDDVLPLRRPIVSKDGRILNSIRIAKGQLVIVPVISINRLKSVWGTDANEFRPERWLDPSTLPSSKSLTQGWNGLSTFSEGARMCIGYRMAIFEFKIILSALLKNFEFFDTGIDVSLKSSLSLQPFVVGREEKGVQLPVGIRMIA